MSAVLQPSLPGYEGTDHHKYRPCPACGSSSPTTRVAWKLVSTRGDTEWLRCSECRSYYMNDVYDLHREVAHTQEMAWGDVVNGEKLNDIKQKMYRAVLTQLSQHIALPGRTLLDIGCSYGGFLSAAADAGLDVFGFDIVPQAVTSAQQKGLRVQCCSQVQEFSLTQQPFDVISILDSNMYWPSQPQELAQIYQRLKPGGLIVMRVVDKSWMASVGAAVQHVSKPFGQKIIRRAINDHRFSMPVGSFLHLLNDTGFRVLTASPRGAIHSDQTSPLVRASFAVGTALWKTAGIFVAPGALIVAERPRAAAAVSA